MIKFKNITGDPFLAVGTIQRKFALNGEKSLSGVLYDGDDVLNNIDKGWSLEFDGEPYVVTYFERNDNDNTLSFDAVHKFFWNMSKSVLYSETSGSHTISWYLDQIFANTGYTYALNFKPKAVSKDNWGMKTKLALFNDIISSISGEFEINGTLISIFEKVGSDLSTIVRYGFNLSDMSIENDAAGFVTYGEGFGAYEDQQNQSGPRLHTTYTSPLASVYGILQAEPVDDQRYTIESNLKDAIKAKIDASFSVSIKLSLYDLTAAGYPYKMAHVGDWLMAIDERLGFKQRIRIISVDDEFDVNGNRINYTVTAGNVGVVQKYQAANASLATQVNNALETANKASDDANIALISANGKNTSYYVDGFDMLPITANEGDLGWVQAGDGRLLYIYTKKPDGTFYWEKRIDPEMQEQITTGVNKAVSDAKDYSDQVVSENVTQINQMLDYVRDKTAVLESEQAELDTKAQGYADKALADAKADVQKTSQDLVTSIQKETADRVAAVSALDTKAKDYADTAKIEAISAATTADGVINKKIDDTASSITTTISQNKADADGKITTAQNTATQALNEVSTKVSKTEYDTKTGQLQTDLNTTTATANQAKTDIVAIKSKDNAQDARMTSIESDANGTKTTVSHLQTEQGKQSGAISTLQQRANGFDATVTKVNNMSVGGRNLFKDSKGLSHGVSANGTTITVEPFDSTTNMWHIVGPAREGWAAGFYMYAYGNEVGIKDGDRWAFSADVKGTGEINIMGIETGTHTPQPAGTLTSDWKRISQTGVAGGGVSFVIYFHTTATQGIDAYIKLPKLETGTFATPWTPAPEDLEEATTKAQLTADQATLAISHYKTLNDGRVADAESKITQNERAIAQKVSQTAYDTKTGQIDSQISSIKQTATSISQSVTNVQNQVNGLSVGGTNLLLDTLDYSNQHQVWRMESVSYTNDGPKGLKATNTSSIWGGPEYNIANLESRGLINTTDTYTFSAWVKNTSSKTVNVSGYGDVTWISGRSNNIPANSDWVRIKATFKFNKATGNTTTIRYEPNVSLTDGAIKLAGHKLEFGNMATDYSPAPEDTDQKISTVSQMVDSINSIVSDPTTGLTKRVQMAEGTLSQVQGVDIPALQKATFWQPYGSLDFNTYTKQGSFFFDTTAAKTNGPTTSTAWTYLIVDQGRNNSDRVTQTAWYDGSNNKVTYRRAMTSGTWGPWYASDNDSVTTISQMNGVITQEVKDRQTGDTNTLTQAKSFTTSSINSSESGIKSLITQTSDTILGKVGATNLFPNSEFEKDYGYRQKDGSLTTLSLSQKNDVDEHLNGTVTVVSNASAWQGYWARNIPVYGGQSYSASVLVHYTNGGIANGQGWLDIWFVDKDGNRINTGTIGPGGSNKNTTSQVASPYWVKLWVENLIAPTNAVYMQVSLLVNNAGAGQTAVFTQPMVTATEKLQPYTPNNDITTQLALLKDNWSIGITDNAGKLASGVFGDINGMTLNGKTVTINANQTVITGTAWINSAMIANGQIGTAQIGDASITSAKISSLDVNKITGNTSNWILSQWKSATGNKVSIDGNGLYFSPGTSRMTTNGFEAWRMDGGSYKAMGMLGSYAWETNSNINGVGLFAKFNGVPHDDPGSPYHGELWGGDTIAIGALEPQIGRGYGYVTPYMIFPSNDYVGNLYFSGNGTDTIIMSRWLSIYTGLNMRGHSIVNSSGYSLKENFRGVTGAEALDVFENTDIMTYDYKPDSEDMDDMTEANRRNKVGFVINDNGQSPFRTDQRLVRYGNTRDDSVTVGYLMAAVKELNAQIKELKAQLGK